MAGSRTIIIAGAGIGGLTASLALAAKGFRVVVLEKAERLEDVGAGLQLSPNASRVLIDLGLEDRISPRAVVPEAISIMPLLSMFFTPARLPASWSVSLLESWDAV